MRLHKVQINKIIFIVMLYATQAFCYNFMTWNVRVEHHDDTLSGNVWGKRLPHLTENIRFVDPDFFNVQEINQNFLNDLEKELSEYKYVYLSEKSENAIFLKKDLSVLKKGEFYLSETPNVRSRGWDAKNKRTCLWAQVQDTLGNTFFIFNTHFDHKGKQARIHSALMILDSLKSIAKGAPLFLSGDFNIDKLEKPFVILNSSDQIEEAQFMTDKRYIPNGSLNLFEPKKYSPWQFDYIFVSKNIKVIKYSVPNFIYYDKDTEVLRYPSDHSPVVIQFNIQ